jgi:phage terminase small subunit
MSRRNKGGLTDQQEVFCQEYLKDLNGKEAAIRAGYSEHTAAEQASRLLAHPLVKERVQALMDKRAKRVEISADRVLKELADIGFAPMGAEGIVEQMRHLVENGVDPRNLSRLAYSEKIKALELLGKHLKLFTEKHEHSGPDGGAIPLAAVPDDQLEQRIQKLLEKAKLGSP